MVDAALRLFAEQGYDETGTEQIAAQAGVSPRTFFRYFPTKESVLFGEYDFIRSFGDVLLAQPDDMSDLAAIRESLIVLAPSIERLRPRVALYRSALASSVQLTGRKQIHGVKHTADMADAIARRRGLDTPDAGAQLVAALCYVVLGHAIDAWVEGAEATTTSALTASFELLSKELSPALADLDM
jgi:AcrR family transcriptional regulator